ncbi:MAG: FecR domain-containing protein [Bacteroidota bacterium]
MKDITPELLEKYYNNTCSEEERKAVEAWLNASEGQSPREEELLASSWQNIQSNIQQRDQPAAITRRLSPRFWLGMAASVVLVLGIGFYTYDTFLHNSSESAISQSQYHNFTTQRGEKRTLTLADGSTIRMNYETEIRAPKRFIDDERIVYLIGHAHFDVAHNPDRPFIIYTEDTKTQVLGTSFDVRTFPDSEKTEVVVSSGKVEFSSREDTQNKVQLTVNDRALLLPGEKISVSEVFAADYTAWKDNRLVFEDASLEEIVLVLERWYDIDITVRNTKLLGNRYTFAYDNPPLPTLLERISFVAKFEYTIEGKQVTIY